MRSTRRTLFDELFVELDGLFRVIPTWTSIPTANFKREGNLDRLAAVTDFRYQGRIANDQEFAWLLSDV